jgi:pyruvoyl-dependent arginine decarboxylase (PvlArgDC)
MFGELNSYLIYMLEMCASELFEASLATKTIHKYNIKIYSAVFKNECGIINYYRTAKTIFFF